MNWTTLAIAAIPMALLAQQDLAFDVASIKPSAATAESSTTDLQPGRFRGTNRTVEWMMRLAYGIQATQISGGPSWLRTTGFDIEAKTDHPATATQKGMESSIGPLLKQLLEDRFQLKTHRDTRSAPVYSLVATRSGLKAKPAQGTELTMRNSIEDGKMVFTGTAISIPTLAGFIAKQTGRSVTDKTGLTGTYDLRLEWAPDSSLDTTAASIFSALQEQLGLRLETTKGPTDLIVVDAISKPSGN